MYDTESKITLSELKLGDSKYYENEIGIVSMVWSGTENKIVVRYSCDTDIKPTKMFDTLKDANKKFQRYKKRLMALLNRKA